MKIVKKIAIAFFLLLVLGACSKEEAAEIGTVTDKKNDGNPAPSFELKDTKGNIHKLSDYAGKKVYIKYWASWCSICLAGLEEINTLSGEEQDFEVLTIVSPGYNNEKKSESFIKWFSGVEHTSNLTVLLDENGSIAKQFQIRGYPTSIFIGSDGVLVKTQPGHLNNDQIMNEFQSIQ